MHHTLRNIFPIVLLVMVAAAFLWAVSFETYPPADFAWQNGDEIRTVDPARATGAPEGRILDAIFEGLLRSMPVGERLESGVQPMEPQPGMADLPDISEDGLVYTFHLRPDARWSNGDPVTAEDFFWSWRRTLHPDTASEYAYQLYYVRGMEKYNTTLVEPGDRVEVELPDRRDSIQPFPRGTIRRGVLQEIVKPPKPELSAAASSRARREADRNWNLGWVYLVEVKPEVDGVVQWDEAGQLVAFCREPRYARYDEEIARCLHVLVDFATETGIEVLDERTLQITLNHPTPYFNHLVAFYPLYPVHRGCVERYGTPFWTKPENIVSNGPYQIQFRRIRDRIRMVKNPYYWDADNVSLEVLDAVAVNSQTTALNMYLEDQLDWVTDVPQTMLADLAKRPDYVAAPGFITYYYRLNVDRPPLDDKRVRQALNLAMDKQLICEHVTRAGHVPARALVPPGLPDYVGAQCDAFDLARARQLLAEAGYPGGRGMPRIEILYNTSESHQAIAESIQQQWKNNLGIDVELRNLEWGVYLDTVSNTDYTVARSGWIGDYPDPNTFLNMFITDGPHNNTNWSNPQYDQLIAEAGREADQQRRLELFREAEEILMDELPIIPIYFYVTINMVKPHVRNFAPTLQDKHALHLLEIER